MSLDLLLHGIAVALGFVAIIVGTVSIRIVLSELRQRRGLHAEELKFKAKEIEHQETVWAAQDRYLARQTARLDQLVDPIADKLKLDLVTDTEWITEALKRSELFPYENSVFGIRSEHFREEKKAIAKHFSPRLVGHFEELLASGHENICIVLDSGTTIYPFFEALGRLAIKQRQSPIQRGRSGRRRWCDSIEIITNNFPGLLQLIKLRPFNGEELPVKCTLVAGQLLPAYVALTGADTENSLRTLLLDRKHKNFHVLSLVTGNWIRLRTTEPPFPVPLARGEGHLDFKQLVMHYSDEIFVISPLGKIFPKISLPSINDLLRDSANTPQFTPYREIDTKHFQDPAIVDRPPGVDVTRTHLVTTMRTDHHSVMRSHGNVIAQYYDMQPQPNVNSASFRSNNPFFVPFDLSVLDRDQQIKQEFPHEDTRKPKFLANFGIT